MTCRTHVPCPSVLLVRSGIAHHAHGCPASGSPHAHADPPGSPTPVALHPDKHPRVGRAIVQRLG